MRWTDQQNLEFLWVFFFFLSLSFSVSVQHYLLLTIWAHGLVPCSICWCWLLTANLLTCTGMGTTILGFLTGSPERLLTLPALILFHLALRFWNQIFTCTSLSFSACAICDRSVRERYFLQWNSFSSSSSCSLVKAVRLLRLFPAELPGGSASWEPPLILFFWDMEPQLLPSEKLSFSLSAELSSRSLHAVSADFKSSFSSSELYSLVSPAENHEKTNYKSLKNAWLPKLWGTVLWIDGTAEKSSDALVRQLVGLSAAGLWTSSARGWLIQSFL